MINLVVHHKLFYISLVVRVGDGGVDGKGGGDVGVGDGVAHPLLISSVSNGYCMNGDDEEILLMKQDTAYCLR